MIVDNKAIRHINSLLPTADFAEIDGARHEIIMEKDNMRDAFLDPVFDMFEAQLS